MSLGFTAIFAFAACGSPRRAGQVQHGALGGDAVARVGETVVAASLVRRVAEEQRIAPLSAIGLLVDDALAANGARAASLDVTAEVRRAMTAARAGFMASHLRDEARIAGPPTDAEVDELTEVHWLQVNLPEQRRVIHAVVLKPKRPSRDLEERASDAASDLAASEAQATSPEDFESRAKAFPHADIELKVERLEPFVADGRVASPNGGAMDRDFVRAAFQLSSISATSGVVATSFGWHVIRLLEILPEHRVPLEDRRRWFKDEAEAMRARRALERLREEVQAKYIAEVANGVDDLMTNATMAVLGARADSPGSTPPAP